MQPTAVGRMPEYTLDDFLSHWNDQGDPSSDHNDMTILRSEGLLTVGFADWKSANQDQRQRSVVEIKERLRALASPGADETQLQNIASNFETKMWGEAKTYREYVRSTAEKLEELSLAQSAAEAEVAAHVAATREVRRSSRLARPPPRAL